MKKSNTVGVLPAASLILTVTVSLLAFNACAWALETRASMKANFSGGQEAPDLDVRQKGEGSKAVPTDGTLTDIVFSFKLDPGITRGLYMGDRWVSPPTFTSVREGKQITINIRAQGMDARGKSRKVSAEWMPSDPTMITVSPSRGREVEITVLHAGQSSLKATSQGVSRELSIKAVYRDNAIQVEISR